MKHYRINTPHIVHDTIDGETIIVNLKNGNYYSFDRGGVLIWETIDIAGNLDSLGRKIAEITHDDFEKVNVKIEGFTLRLLEEELIAEEDTQADGSENENGSLPLALNELKDFPEPLLNKYSDMQDMLLLDPIHDTDETGWPSGITES